MRGHDVFISLGRGHALTMNPPRIWCYSPRGPRACIHTRLIFVRLGYMTCGVVETAVQPCVKVYGILIGSTAMSSGIRVRPGSAKIGKAFRYRRVLRMPATMHMILPSERRILIRRRPNLILSCIDGDTAGERMQKFTTLSSLASMCGVDSSHYD
jgi:hypothetical protein